MLTAQTQTVIPIALRPSVVTVVEMVVAAAKAGY
jgi:hypothetical protein